MRFHSAFPSRPIIKSRKIILFEEDRRRDRQAMDSDLPLAFTLLLPPPRLLPVVVMAVLLFSLFAFRLFSSVVAAGFQEQGAVRASRLATTGDGSMSLWYELCRFRPADGAVSICFHITRKRRAKGDEDASSGCSCSCRCAQVKGKKGNGNTITDWCIPSVLAVLLYWQ